MTNTKLQTGIVVVAALAVVALFFGLQSLGIEDTETLSLTEVPQGNLVVQDEVVGTGEVARAGDVVLVHYTGRYQDGTVFESSVGGDPIDFVLGTGRVIPGWDQGLQGMKVGGKRLLIIPPHLAYGSQQYGPIPPNSTLVFEVEMVGVTPAGSVQ